MVINDLTRYDLEYLIKYLGVKLRCYQSVSKTEEMKSDEKYIRELVNKLFAHLDD